MPRTCQWLVLDEDGREVPCGKVAHFHIDWGGGAVYWYCAEHYDIRIEFVRSCGRTDVLRLSGAL